MGEEVACADVLPATKSLSAFYQKFLCCLSDLLLSVGGWEKYIELTLRILFYKIKKGSPKSDGTVFGQFASCSVLPDSDYLIPI